MLIINRPWLNIIVSVLSSDEYLIRLSFRNLFVSKVTSMEVNTGLGRLIGLIRLIGALTLRIIL